MGSGASKASKAATEAAKRQYPTRVPHNATTAARPPPRTEPAESGPAVHPRTHASSRRDDAVNSDAYDPHLAESLRMLGPVQTAPTYSHTSSAPPTSVEKTAPNSESDSAPIFPSPETNPALLVLEARRLLAERAEQEFEQIGRKGFTGKEFVDVHTVKRALNMRSRRVGSDAEIEEELNLRPGVMKKLGPLGLNSDATMEI